MSQQLTPSRARRTRILVNYQSGDAESHAHRLIQMLRRRFGSDNVATRVDTSTDETAPTRGGAGGREVLLAVVGRRWRRPPGGPLSETGYRRPRAKQSRASARTHARELIFVVVDAAPMPAKGVAPRAVRLRDARWDDDFEKLAGWIEAYDASSRTEDYAASRQTVGVIVSRGTAIDLLYALVVNLGGAATETGYKGKETDYTEEEPYEWPVEAGGKADREVGGKGGKGVYGGSRGTPTGGGKAGRAVGGKGGRPSRVTAPPGGKGAGPSRVAAPPPAPAGLLVDEVCCTAFAPPQVAPGARFMVQVFAHLEDDDVKAAELAAEFDSAAKRRGTRPLDRKVARETTLYFSLSFDGLPFEESVKSIVWRGKPGRPQSVQFRVEVPASQPPGNVSGLVEVRADGVPLGDFLFQITVEEKTAAAAPAATEPQATGTWVPFRKAFVSYASVDRGGVVIALQKFDIVGIDYFMDNRSLKPGDIWEREISKHIDESDLFLLFWTVAASQSEWVLKEVSHAVARQKNDPSAPPAIKPMLLDGSQPPPPPAGLNHLHFDSPLRVYMTIRERQQAGSPKQRGANKNPKAKGPASG